LDSDADYVDLKLTTDKSFFERDLRELKFRKICTHVTLCYELGGKELKTENTNPNYYVPSLNMDRINKITRKCRNIFTTSRFSLDELLEKDLFLNFFYEWIKNSLSNKSYIKFVFNDSFCVLKPDNDDMVIDLIGVPREMQGKGIGSKLIWDAINYSKKEGYRRIWATTEVENPAAFKLYSKNGFKIKYFTSSFHLRVEDLKKTIAW
jgi:ribosomal protein S18 acetylase RimI-like enzyme